MPNIFDYFCTTNGLYTHYDRNVIKLPNSSQVSRSCFDSFYADLLPTPAVPSPSSSHPVPAPVDLRLSQPFFTFSDFCDLLYFRRCICTDSEDLDDEIGQSCLGAYKHVDRKVKPVSGRYPEDARVHRQFPENPLDSLTPLTPLPPDFIPTKKLTNERLASMKLNSDGFLWPEEEKLFAHVMKLNEAVLAFDESERGNFRSSYFSPYIIPILPHEPWEYRNIPIPPGIRERVIQLLRDKMAARLYEPAQSSYRSKWFCVMKKNGKIRIVHDLQPLNKVTIRDAGVPPILDDFVEPFAGRQCYTVFDLFSGFDARQLHPDS